MSAVASGSREATAPLPEGSVPAQAQSPNKKRKSKLDTSAKAFLTEIFALQDSLTPFETEALAAKVNPPHFKSKPAFAEFPCLSADLSLCLYLHFRWDIAQP